MYRQTGQCSVVSTPVIRFPISADPVRRQDGQWVCYMLDYYVPQRSAYLTRLRREFPFGFLAGLSVPASSTVVIQARSVVNVVGESAVGSKREVRGRSTAFLIHRLKGVAKGFPGWGSWGWRPRYAVVTG